MDCAAKEHDSRLQPHTVRLARTSPSTPFWGLNSPQHAAAVPFPDDNLASQAARDKDATSSHIHDGRDVPIVASAEGATGGEVGDVVDSHVPELLPTQQHVFVVHRISLHRDRCPC